MCQRIRGRFNVRAAIDAELDARGIAHEWFEDGRTGERRLLFRTDDARGLADSLGSLADKVEAAHEQAARAVGRARETEEAERDGGDPRTDRRLRDRVRTVRRYAEAPERAVRAGREPERAESLERGRS